jgi:GAF domain-containing protein
LPTAVPAEQRAAELEALRQVSLSLSASLELEAVLDALLQSALRLLPLAERADVFLYQAGQLTANASCQPGQPRSRAPNAPRPGGLTYTVARTGQPLVVPDARHHPLFAADDKFRPLGAIVGLPLLAGQRVVGVMNISYTAPHAFADDELRLLNLLGGQAAAAIENARLFETTRWQVRELTVLHQVAAAAVEAGDEDALIERATGIIGAHIFTDNFRRPAAG